MSIPTRIMMVVLTTGILIMMVGTALDETFLILAGVMIGLYSGGWLTGGVVDKISKLLE